MAGSVTDAAACAGYCRACGRDHVLGEGTARDRAMEVLAGFRETERLDHDRPVSRADPRLRGERLWEREGRMFGVLEGVDAGGRPVVLRAFSSLAGGIRWVPGWAPPLLERTTRAREVLPVERRIKQITRRLRRLDEGDPERARLTDLRRSLSRHLMERLHDLHHLENFRGVRRTVRAAWAGPGGIPGGVGECCAPKLLTWAARLGVRPRGLVEFYWGAPTPSSNRRPGTFHAPCARRCRPILGFLLCGLAR